MANLDENYLKLIRSTLYTKERTPVKTRRPSDDHEKFLNSKECPLKKGSKRNIARSLDLKASNNDNKGPLTTRSDADPPTTKKRKIKESTTTLNVQHQEVNTEVVGATKNLDIRKKKRLKDAPTNESNSSKSGNNRLCLLTDSVIVTKPKKEGKNTNRTESHINGNTDDLLITKNEQQKKKKHKALMNGSSKKIIVTKANVGERKMRKTSKNPHQYTKENTAGKKRKKNYVTLNQAEEEEPEDAGDFYDAEISVKGLKIERFFNMFPPTHSELVEHAYDTLNIPKKFFKQSQDDKFQWQPEQNGNNKKQKKTVDVPPPNPPEQPPLEEAPIDLQQREMANLPVILNLENNAKIVVLEDLNQCIHFNGLFSLEMLNGEVEILGASLSKASGQKNVYSPRGSSLLYIKNKSKLYQDSNVQLKNLVSKGLLNENQTEMYFKQHCAIIMCKELREPYIKFIEDHISQKILPESSSSGPRVNFELSGNWNKIWDSEIWEDVLENVIEVSRIVICGGKGVGKSTFLRYSVNMLLKKFKQIRVIDLDPGQSEFCPPGCITITTVDEEILGPNYTHLKQPDRSLLSHINIGHNVQDYLQLVKYLLESMNVTEILPTLINFPGYTRQLGLDITANMLNYLQPTLVVEIKSKTVHKNYKMDVSSENIKEFLDKNKLLESKGCKIPNYEYVKFNGFSERNEVWSLEARQAREICVLAYFGKTMKEGVQELISATADLYSINISAITIANYEGDVISPLAINGSLVALCSVAPTNSKIFISHGFGFVRGIDLETDTLVLLTPEPIEVLKNATHLVLSSVSTPPSLIMSTGSAEGHIAYVNVGELIDFGQLTKRPYLPPRNRVSQ